MTVLQSRDLNLPDNPSKRATTKNTKCASDTIKHSDSVIEKAKQQCIKLIDSCQLKCKNISHPQSPPPFTELKNSLSNIDSNNNSSSSPLLTIGSIYETIGIWFFNINRHTQAIQIINYAIAMFKVCKKFQLVSRCKLLIAQSMLMEITENFHLDKLNECEKYWKLLMEESNKIDLELESDIGYYYGLSLLRLSINGDNIKILIIPKIIDAWTNWLTIPNKYSPSERSINKPSIIRHHSHRQAAGAQLNYLYSRLSMIGDHANLQLQCLELITLMHDVNQEYSQKSCSLLQQALLFARHGNFAQSRILMDEAAKYWTKAEKQRNSAKSSNDVFLRQLGLYKSLQSQLHLTLSVSFVPQVLKESIINFDYKTLINGKTGKPNLYDAITQAELFHSLSLIHWREGEISESLMKEKSAYGIWNNLFRSIQNLLLNDKNSSNNKQKEKEIKTNNNNSRYNDMFLLLSSQSSLHPCWIILSSMFQSLTHLYTLYEYIGNIRSSLHYLSLAQQLSESVNGNELIKLNIEKQRMEMKKDFDVNKELIILKQKVEENNEEDKSDSNNDENENVDADLDVFSDYQISLQKIFFHCHEGVWHQKNHCIEESSHSYQLALDLLNNLIETPETSDDEDSVQIESDEENDCSPLRAYRAHIAVKLSSLPEIDNEALKSASDDSDECRAVIDAAWANYWLAQIDQKTPEKEKQVLEKAKRSTRTTKKTIQTKKEEEKFELINSWNLHTTKLNNKNTSNYYRLHDGVKQAQNRLSVSLAATFNFSPPRLTRLLSLEYCQSLGLTDPMRASFLLNHSIGVSHRHTINAINKEKQNTRNKSIIKSSATITKKTSKLLDEHNNDDMDEICLSMINSLNIDEEKSPEDPNKNSAINDSEQSLEHFKGNFESEYERFIKFLPLLPSDWSMVTIGLTEDNRYLIISQHQNSSSPSIIRLPLCHLINSSSSDESVYDWARKELFSIIADSSAVNESVPDKSRCTTRDKEEWWSKRYELDERMKNLLLTMEKNWFGPWIGLLKGKLLNNKLEKIIHQKAKLFIKFINEQLAINININSQDEDENDDDSDNQILESLIIHFFNGYDNSLLNESQLQSSIAYLLGFVDSPNDSSSIFIKSFTIEQTKLLKLTTKEFMNYYKKIQKEREKINLQQNSSGPVILLLDSRLQCFPFETFPSLINETITRIISWTDIETRLLASYNKIPQQLSISYKSSHYYLLNPGGDLKRTQETIAPHLSSLGLTNGLIGSCPSSSELLSIINKNLSLFLYCGHGSCDQFLTRESVEILSSPPSVAILMGCSSGKIKNVTNELEGEGMIVSLIRAGSHCIIGNLWDVTDGDCDRFTINLLTRIKNNASNSLSLPSLVQQSRSSCKLKYLMGSSPVVYGLPLSITG